MANRRKTRFGWVVILAALLASLLQANPAGATTEPAASETMLIRNSPTNMFFVNGDGRWWAGDCGTDAESAGMLVVDMAWTEIEAVPTNPAPPSCDNVLDSFTPTASSLVEPLGVEIYRNSPTNMFFVTDEGRWWAGDCASSAIEAGVSIVETDWTSIDAIQSHPAPPTCEAILASPLDVYEEVGRLLTTPDKSLGDDGWYEHADGTKQWIDANCRELYMVLGADIDVLSWAEIDAIPDAEPQPCDELPLPAIKTDFAHFDIGMDGGIVEHMGAELHIPTEALQEDSVVSVISFTSGLGHTLYDFHIEPPTWTGQVKLRIPGEAGGTIHHRLSSTGEVVAEPTAPSGDGHIEAWVSELSAISEDSAAHGYIKACFVGGTIGFTFGIHIAGFATIGTGGAAAPLAGAALVGMFAKGCLGSVADHALFSDAGILGGCATGTTYGVLGTLVTAVRTARRPWRLQKSADEIGDLVTRSNVEGCASGAAGSYVTGARRERSAFTPTAVVAPPPATASTPPATSAPVFAPAPVYIPPAAVFTQTGQISATGRRGACEFGSNCLVVGFSVSGFSPAPVEYTCVFSDGYRATFYFSSSTTGTACVTNDSGDWVEVEIGGVRSNRITAANTPATITTTPPAATGGTVAANVGVYPTVSAVTVRESTTIFSTAVRSIKRGHNVPLVCWLIGQDVNPLVDVPGTNRYWYRLPSGNFVADTALDTAAIPQPGVPKC